MQVPRWNIELSCINVYHASDVKRAQKSGEKLAPALACGGEDCERTILPDPQQKRDEACGTDQHTFSVGHQQTGEEGKPF